MTDDELEDMVASIAAHDMLLQFLFANLIRLFPDNQRQTLVDAILNMPDLAVPEGMAKNFDSADRLAGVAMKVQAKMSRIAQAAANTAQSRGGSNV